MYSVSRTLDRHEKRLQTCDSMSWDAWKVNVKQGWLVWLGGKPNADKDWFCKYIIFLSFNDEASIRVLYCTTWKPKDVKRTHGSGGIIVKDNIVLRLCVFTDLLLFIMSSEWAPYQVQPPPAPKSSLMVADHESIFPAIITAPFWWKPRCTRDGNMQSSLHPCQHAIDEHTWWNCLAVVRRLQNLSWWCWYGLFRVGTVALVSQGPPTRANFFLVWDESPSWLATYPAHYTKKVWYVRRKRAFFHPQTWLGDNR